MPNVHLQQGNIVEAEAAYRRALDLDPDRAPALNNLAWLILIHGGDRNEAEALARRATEVAPDNANYADTLQRIVDARNASH
jgi:Flp pilus assembly protein TadD